jgi:hypothetical protein
VNGWFYLWDERFPSRLRCSPWLDCCRLPPPRGLRWRSTFSLFFAIDLVFYAGSYNYGADVRYSLMTYPPLAVLGGLGAAQLARGIARLGAGLAVGVPARALVVIALLFQFLWYAPIVRATTEEAWAARADVRFAQAVATELPRNSYVLTHNPGMFHLWGVNAGQMSLVSSNPAYVRFLARRYRRNLSALELLVQRAGSCAAGDLSHGDRDGAGRDREGVSRARSALRVLPHEDR